MLLYLIFARKTIVEHTCILFFLLLCFPRLNFYLKGCFSWHVQITTTGVVKTTKHQGLWLRCCFLSFSNFSEVAPVRVSLNTNTTTTNFHNFMQLTMFILFIKRFSLTSNKTYGKIFHLSTLKNYYKFLLIFCFQVTKVSLTYYSNVRFGSNLID